MKMLDGQRLVVELRKLKVPVAIIKKQWTMSDGQGLDVKLRKSRFHWLLLRSKWTMSDGHRLVVELGKLKVSVATIKKQISNVWEPDTAFRLRKFTAPEAIMKHQWTMSCSQRLAVEL
jgi:ribose 5-phosphate isomerase